MSARDPAADGTFDLLDNANESARQRYVDNRSHEELVAIILAV